MSTNRSRLDQREEFLHSHSLFNFEGIARYFPKSVLIAMRTHLFPYRTQKLSSSVSKILGWRRPGKIERRRHKAKKPGIGLFWYFSFESFHEAERPHRMKRKRYSSLAQSVERSAVNRNVVGSSPTGGATKSLEQSFKAFFFCRKVFATFTGGFFFYFVECK